MTIPSLPPERRKAVEAAVDALGHFPSVKEAQEIAKRHSCSPSTVRRIAKHRTPPVAHGTQSPAPSEAPKPAKAKAGVIQENLSPAIAKAPKPRPEPETEEREDSGPFACDACGCQWRLDPGEAQLNSCPECKQPFA